MDTTIVAPLGTIFLLVVLVALMLICFQKFRYFPVIFTLWVFSMVLGVMALNVDLPLSPFIQIFFLVFQSIMFILDVFDVSKSRVRGGI